MPPRISTSSSTGRTERWACNQQRKTGKTGKAEKAGQCTQKWIERQTQQIDNLADGQESNVKGRQDRKSGTLM
jgi:hypothetical protein